MPMSHDPSTSTPTFQRIKEDIPTHIRNGGWRGGGVIPGETMLAQTLGVSHMTVNRTLRKLITEQVLTRAQRLGTFVAQ